MEAVTPKSITEVAKRFLEKKSTPPDTESGVWNPGHESKTDFTNNLHMQTQISAPPNESAKNFMFNNVFPEKNILQDSDRFMNQML